jgi:signal transduction histidine kinase
MKEMIIVSLVLVVVILIKRNESLSKRNFFYQFTNNEQFTSYIQELINVFESTIISLNKKKEVLFVNRLPSFSNVSDTDRTENNQKDEITLSIVNSFLNSLVLNDVSIGFESFLLGMRLEDIIDEIIIKKDYNSEEFKRLGYFHREYNNVSSYFEIHFRKLHVNGNIVELLLYNVTNIKVAEKTRAETKYKQKILAKVAHEFKTPLIAISSLVKKIKEEYLNCFSCRGNFGVILNQIDNLSNYSIILVSDLIQYVSKGKKIINQNEINIRELMQFCFGILKTIIECEIFKTTKLETMIEIDDNIDNFKIISNEDCLKQILLNFISNSVKFTKKGHIKIIVSYNRISNKVEICVADTGIGIKEEEKSFIFNKIIEMDVDKNYNHKGTGLGLSICKSLADLIEAELDFTSNYQIGSLFYIKLNIIEIIPNENVEIIEKLDTEKTQKIFGFPLVSIESLLEENNYLGLHNSNTDAPYLNSVKGENTILSSLKLSEKSIYGDKILSIISYKI